MQEVSSLVQTQLYDVLCVQASSRAFAALRQDGCVVAWGDPCFGGAAVQVQNQLLCAVAIQSTSWAFAALLADGSVVSWGEGEDEIPWTAMKKDLTSVTCIAATGGDRLPLPEIGGDYSAFAALRSDGSVVTWGSRQFGGQTASVQEKWSRPCNWNSGHL